MDEAGAVDAADIDGDSDTDVLGAGGGLLWYENDSSQSFAARELDTPMSHGHYDVVAADVDGDADQVPFAA